VIRVVCLLPSHKRMHEALQHWDIASTMHYDAATCIVSLAMPREALLRAFIGPASSPYELEKVSMTLSPQAVMLPDTYFF
jgi:hypothetical protein